MGGRGSEQNLILGIAEDLDWEELRPFVESLARTSFDGETRLFVAGTTDHTVRRLEREGVRVHRYRRLRLERDGTVFDAYNPPLRRFRSARITRFYPSLVRALSLPAADRGRAQALLAAPLSSPHVGRFFRFYRCLSRTVSRYRNVMLTDVRDVFFLRDPFEFDIGEKVYCYLEDPRVTLASEWLNSRWLARAYGQPVLLDLRDRPVSCSGVTIGYGHAVVGYLRAMVELLTSQLRAQPFGTDQAVHNYLVHNRLAPNVELVPHGEGAVMTLGIVPGAEVLATLPSGYSKFNVLHQYDRHPALVDDLLRRLSDPMTESQPHMGRVGPGTSR